MKVLLWDRFESKVLPEPNTGCWLWVGPHVGGGYGALWVNGHNRVAHRLLFEKINGPVPVGLELDHLCRVRCCVNPKHLEAVPRKVNLGRGLHRNRVKLTCLRGHPFDTVKRQGQRRCSVCHAQANNRYYHRKQKGGPK